MDPYLEQFVARRKEREQADRSFTLLGETLTVKASVAPEVGLRRGEFERRLAVFAATAEEARKANKPLPELGFSDQELLDLSDSIIFDCLEPASHDTWRKLRSPDSTDPLGLLEIYGLSGYVLSKASALPTGGPSASSDGQRSNGSSSTARSSSRAATRKR